MLLTGSEALVSCSFIAPRCLGKIRRYGCTKRKANTVTAASVRIVAIRCRLECCHLSRQIDGSFREGGLASTNLDPTMKKMFGASTALSIFATPVVDITTVSLVLARVLWLLHSIHLIGIMMRKHLRANLGPVFFAVLSVLLVSFNVWLSDQIFS
jgi:hypothetical protein